MAKNQPRGRCRRCRKANQPLAVTAVRHVGHSQGRVTNICVKCYNELGMQKDDDELRATD